MSDGLRAIERQLVCQRMQVLAMPIAENFVETWEQALENGDRLPDELDLVQALAKEEVPLLTATPLFSYLNQCKRDRTTPDPGRMVLTIVHGFAEMRLSKNKHCRCPAKMPLGVPGTRLFTR